MKLLDTPVAENTLTVAEVAPQKCSGRVPASAKTQHKTQHLFTSEKQVNCLITN